MFPGTAKPMQYLSTQFWPQEKKQKPNQKPQTPGFLLPRMCTGSLWRAALAGLSSPTTGQQLQEQTFPLFTLPFLSRLYDAVSLSIPTPAGISIPDLSSCQLLSCLSHRQNISKRELPPSRTWYQPSSHPPGALQHHKCFPYPIPLSCACQKLLSHPCHLPVSSTS